MPEGQEKGPVPAPPTPPRRPRALVVDDDAAVRGLLMTFLRQQGLDVTPAPDGPAGLAAFAAGGFALVLLDLDMPGMDGLQLAQAIRRQDPAVPIALLSGRLHTLTPQRLAQAGITRAFAKPFALHELAAWLRALALAPPPP
ncbi:MAG: hypothetical protein KatS3mg131_1131 [Candidatus Tectimicrobiota bacterium]|nr:MAG: hypothetical protein KatS3mg131_1131 [Candidatus Tectomicrobia bacterium]